MEEETNLQEPIAVDAAEVENSFEPVNKDANVTSPAGDEEVEPVEELPTRKEHKKKKKQDKEREELIKTNQELQEKLLRINAEMQNMRRRFDTDLSNAYKYDGYDLIEKILPIIDNFERAMSIKVEGTEKFLDGFKMIHENLIFILKAKGINEVECLNKLFDPSSMNAVVTEVNNDFTENTVLEVLQKGYTYHERLIRPAMVKVSTIELDESA